MIQIDEATRIRVVRAMLGLTSKQFASKVGVGPSAVTAWEKGRATPQREKRKELAKICQDAGIAFLPSGCPVPMTDIFTQQEP
jgi:DNA-binding XRE family transcriptional regulator